MIFNSYVSLPEGVYIYTHTIYLCLLWFSYWWLHVFMTYPGKEVWRQHVFFSAGSSKMQFLASNQALKRIQDVEYVEHNQISLYLCVYIYDYIIYVWLYIYIYIYKCVFLFKTRAYLNQDRGRVEKFDSMRC